MSDGAIDRGCRGYFITFPELIDRLFKSMADHSQDKVFRRFASFDCLGIDEVGYVEVESAQVGQFFTLMQRRHKAKTTLITSNLGFSEYRQPSRRRWWFGCLERFAVTQHGGQLCNSVGIAIFSVFTTK